jgi:aminoglycoside 6'-N-acetyltransferase I
MNIRLREAENRDFPDWLRMRDALYSGLTQEFHETEMAIYHKAADKACVLAFLEGEETPIGFMELSLRNVVDGCLSSPVGYLEGIYIELTKRGAGITRALLSYAIGWAKARGCTELASDTELENTEAQRFHEHLGFKETYRIVQYKMDLSEPK